MQIPNNALQGLGALATSPLGRAVFRYWWVAAPLGALAWHYWKKREAKGDASIGTLVHDMAPVVGTVVGLVTLNQLMAHQEATAKPFASATDASFTLQPKA